MLSIWCYVDPNSSMMSNDEASDWNRDHPDEKPRTGSDMEYEGIERCFREGFPEQQMRFSFGMAPRDLSNSCPDFYVFDIGGMDYGGMGRHRFCTEVAKQLADHPNTLFVPWSAFTHSYAKGALQDFLLGEDDEDSVWDAKMVPHNILILDSDTIYDGGGLLSDKILSRLKTMYQKRNKSSGE